MADYTGPCAIDCQQSCEVPKGQTLSEVPRPRHAWPDILCCPHGGCGRAFLVVPQPKNNEPKEPV